MSRSWNAAASRITAALIACTALAGPSVEAGVIALENQLPVAASCVVRTDRGTLNVASGQWHLARHTLLAADLTPRATHSNLLPYGIWPVEERFDAQSVPYTVSPAFVALHVSCRIGPAGGDGHEHVASFVNVDFRPPQHAAQVNAADPFAGAYPLSGYTPTDNTRFLMQLRPTIGSTTAAELLAGASLSLELAVLPMAVAPNPYWVRIGRFEMMAPLFDDGHLTPSVSDSDSD